MKKRDKFDFFRAKKIYFVKKIHFEIKSETVHWSEIKVKSGESVCCHLFAEILHIKENRGFIIAWFDCLFSSWIIQYDALSPTVNLFFLS